MHELTLGLLNASDLKTAVSNLYQVLIKRFSTDFVALKIIIVQIQFKGIPPVRHLTTEHLVQK